MNATQQYAPTHGYLDSHNPHLGHNGAAHNATSYATYQPPMLSTSHSSYAPTHGPSYYPYSSASSMAPHHYSHASIPSIASLPGMSNALSLILEAVLINMSSFTSSPNDNRACPTSLSTRSKWTDWTSWQASEDHGNTLGRRGNLVLSSRVSWNLRCTTCW